MVLVTLLNIECSEKRGYDDVYVFELDIRGFKPKSGAQAIEFITNWAKTLEFDIESKEASKHYMIRKLGYIISELTRNKIYVGTIPTNTYWLETNKQINCDETDCLLMYVDEGSPVRHIYFVLAGDKPEHYRIWGHGIYVSERIDISTYFSETIYSSFAKHVSNSKHGAITRFLFDHGKTFQKYKSLIDDTEIHTVLHPNLDENMREYFETIFKLVEKERKKQKKRAKEH